MDDVLDRDDISKSRKEDDSQEKRARWREATRSPQFEIFDMDDLSPSPEPEVPVHHCNCRIADNYFVYWRPDYSLSRFRGIPWCIECGGYFLPHELDQRKREALKTHREQCSPLPAPRD
jgi:hypothetical protein